MDQTRSWARELEPAVERSAVFDRFEVLDSAGSTQDEAWARCADRPGLVLVAEHQRAGRGQRGSSWFDHPRHSLAMSMVLPATDLQTLSARIGVGVAAAIANEAPKLKNAIGLLWPNDIVEKSGEHKLAGVLIEARGDLACVGVGLNVGHAYDDFAPDIRDRATSLSLLSAPLTRQVLAAAIVREVSRAMTLTTDECHQTFSSLSVIVGTRRRFEIDGRGLWCRVESINPDNSVRVSLPDGEHATIRAGDARLDKSQS